MKFVKATKKQAHARVALSGPPGAGKTYTALRIMRGLVGPNGRIAVIDSERGSASKYAHDPDNGPCPEGLFVFDTLDLDNYHPDTYAKAIDLAVREGYDGIIVDSLSHAWMGKDGALEQVDKRANDRGGKFAAWAHVTPMQQRLVDTLLRAPAHVVATMRTKIEWTLIDGKTPKKLGTKVEQRDGIEYEFDVVGEISVDQQLSISKTRCSAITGAIIDRPSEDLGAMLGQWLTDGAPMPPPVERPAGAPASNGTGKLPMQQQTPAAGSKPAAAATPFDLAAVLARVALADTREDAISAAAAAAGMAAQPESIRNQVKAAINARSAEIDRAKAAAPSAQASTPAAAQPAQPEPTPAAAASPPPAEQAADPDPTADPGWLHFLAAIQKASGEITEGWTEAIALDAWIASLNFAKDRDQLEELCGPWVAAARKCSGMIVHGLRPRLDADYKARRAQLPAATAPDVAA